MTKEELKARIIAKEDELRPEQPEITDDDLRWLATLHVFLEVGNPLE